MLRKRQHRRLLWVAAMAFGLASVVSWMIRLGNAWSGGWPLVPVGLTVMAFIWLANALAAEVAVKTSEGNNL